MHRVTTIDLDRIEFRLVGTRAPSAFEATDGLVFVYVFVYLFLAQLLFCGLCAWGLLSDLGWSAGEPFGSLLIMVLSLPVAVGGAAYVLTIDSVHGEPQTITLELRGTEVRVDGVAIPRQALVVEPHRIRAPDLTVDFDPPLGPEILGPLSDALAQRDRLVAAQSGGSVPPELDRLRDRDT